MVLPMGSHPTSSSSIISYSSLFVKHENEANLCYNSGVIITYQGGDSFKISQGDLTLVVNPKTKVTADVTLFTGPRAETAEKAGFVIDGPGEYEVKDVFIKGFLHRAEGVLKTIYLITFEGMKLCFLGALGTVEEIEDVDILFVPVGTDAAAAYKLAVSLESAIIIPMQYDKNSLGQFLKEGGEKGESIDKFVVKKKDLEGKEGDIVVLKEE